MLKAADSRYGRIKKGNTMRNPKECTCGVCAMLQEARPASQTQAETQAKTQAETQAPTPAQTQAGIAKVNEHNKKVYNAQFNNGLHKANQVLARIWCGD